MCPGRIIFLPSVLLLRLHIFFFHSALFCSSFFFFFFRPASPGHSGSANPRTHIMPGCHGTRASATFTIYLLPVALCTDSFIRYFHAFQGNFPRNNINIKVANCVLKMEEGEGWHGRRLMALLPGRVRKGGYLIIFCVIRNIANSSFLNSIHFGEKIKSVSCKYTFGIFRNVKYF